MFVGHIASAAVPLPDCWWILARGRSLVRTVCRILHARRRKSDMELALHVAMGSRLGLSCCIVATRETKAPRPIELLGRAQDRQRGQGVSRQRLLAHPVLDGRGGAATGG